MFEKCNNFYDKIRYECMYICRKQFFVHKEYSMKSFKCILFTYNPLSKPYLHMLVLKNVYIHINKKLISIVLLFCNILILLFDYRDIH